MDRKKIILFIILLLAIGAYNIYAQSAGLNITTGFPMNEFKDNVKRTGIGLSGQFLFWTPDTKYPYSFGVNLGFINYGSEGRREPFNDMIPDVAVDVERTNNIVNFHLLGQIIPPTGSIRPYLEVLVGGAYIYTETRIVSRGADEIASTVNFDDWTLNYGGGVGVQFQLPMFRFAPPVISSIFIDLKVRYINGLEAQYLKEGSVRIERGRAVYEVSKSRTDLLTVNIGAIVYFNDLFGNKD